MFQMGSNHQLEEDKRMVVLFLTLADMRVVFFFLSTFKHQKYRGSSAVESLSCKRDFEATGDVNLHYCVVYIIAYISQYIHIIYIYIY